MLRWPSRPALSVRGGGQHRSDRHRRDQAGLVEHFRSPSCQVLMGAAEKPTAGSNCLTKSLSVSTLSVRADKECARGRCSLVGHRRTADRIAADRRVPEACPRTSAGNAPGSELRRVAPGVVRMPRVQPPARPAGAVAESASPRMVGRAGPPEARDRTRADVAVTARARHSAKWQAAQCPGRSSRRRGSRSEHSGAAIGHRVLNRQPGGGLAGLGTSPLRMTRSRRASSSGS